MDDDGSEGRNVVSTEAFTEDVEIVGSKAGIDLEESDQEDLEISDGIHSVVWSFATTD